VVEKEAKLIPAAFKNTKKASVAKQTASASNPAPPSPAMFLKETHRQLGIHMIGFSLAIEVMPLAMVLISVVLYFRSQGGHGKFTPGNSPWLRFF
jgi:hypothetical protein